MSAGFRLTKEPKLWKELSSDDKIERLRSTIKSLQHQLGDLENKNRELKKLLSTHHHNATGETTVRVEELEGINRKLEEHPTSYIYGECPDDDVYF